MNQGCVIGVNLLWAVRMASLLDNSREKSNCIKN